MSRRAHWLLRLGGIAVILVAQLLPRVGAHDAAAKAPAAPADEASSGLGSSHATDTVEVAGR